MCGIIGIIGSEKISDKLFEGLSRLEYRGYDSAGIATVTSNHQILRCRAAGKLRNLGQLLNDKPLEGAIGIGHTRWATHGIANHKNAHPHGNQEVAIVHNGIIENYALLKQSLEQRGYVFESDTDTEVIVHLITDYLKGGLLPLQAVQYSLKQLQGAFAVVILLRQLPNMLIAARQGSPLVIGSNSQELFVASDALTLAGWADHICYLEEGDMVVLEKKEKNLSCQFYDHNSQTISRNWTSNQILATSVSKGDYSHFMLKEIFEQPAVLCDTIQAFTENGESLSFSSFNVSKETLSRVIILACGTSYYAGLVAKYWFEKYFLIETHVEIASEFRYRSPLLDRKALYIFLSQSGETIDTLAALSLVKDYDCSTLGIVNVAESSIARAATNTLLTLAGPEIGVASTKAFTAQLMTLFYFGIYFSQSRIHSHQTREFLNALRLVPRQISHILENCEIFRRTALSLSKAYHALYLGRGLHYPIALEGALKLKELSYIHAEGYASGELKHGPIALIDNQIPIIVLAPYDEWFEKTLSNVQEVLARDACVIILTDNEGRNHINHQSIHNSKVEVLILPQTISILSPFLYTVAVQLLAYYTALHRGTDIDQPRNLAKSVTVE